MKRCTLENERVLSGWQSLVC